MNNVDKKMFFTLRTLKYTITFRVKNSHDKDLVLIHDIFTLLDTGRWATLFDTLDYELFLPLRMFERARPSFQCLDLFSAQL